MSLIALAAVTVGLHIGSVHAPARDFNNSNPGLYLQYEHAIGGCYRNSIDRTTCHAGYVQDLGQGFSVMVGAATGYQKKCSNRSETTVHTEKRTDGMTVTTRSTLTYTDCTGFSRGALAPTVALLYTSPAQVWGVTPRIWLVPGIDKSSTVVHLGIQRSINLF